MAHQNIDNILNKYREKKLAHAFLLETNNIDECLNDLNHLIKNILCEASYKKECDECNLCYQIDSDSLPSVIKIYPDGASIKKNQILELKEKFQTEAVYSKYNIYIIVHAEKMNSSSANTMLKFLEEPEGQVIGFFVTDNKENIIDTIKSRCQIISLIYDVDNIHNSLGINEQEFKSYLPVIEEYLKYIENDIDMAFLKNKSLILDTFNDRIQIDLFFKILLKIYESKLLELTNNQKSELLVKLDVINGNSIINIIKKMKVIENIISKMIFNPNLELLLDKFVLETRKIK